MVLTYFTLTADPLPLKGKPSLHKTVSGSPFRESEGNKKKYFYPALNK